MSRKELIFERRFALDHGPYIDTQDCVFWPYTLAPQGYAYIGLNGKKEAVHRIACEKAHGPAPVDKPFALHKCGNRNCVNAAHLYWGDAQDNADDRIRHGTNLSGERCGPSKLTWAAVNEIRRLYAKGGVTQEELGERFGTHWTNIGCIVRRETWVTP